MNNGTPQPTTPVWLTHYIDGLVAQLGGEAKIRDAALSLLRQAAHQFALRSPQIPDPEGLIASAAVAGNNEALALLELYDPDSPAHIRGLFHVYLNLSYGERLLHRLRTSPPRTAAILAALGEEDSGPIIGQIASFFFVRHDGSSQPELPNVQTLTTLLLRPRPLDDGPFSREGSRYWQQARGVVQIIRNIAPRLAEDSRAALRKVVLHLGVQGDYFTKLDIRPDIILNELK